MPPSGDAVVGGLAVAVAIFCFGSFGVPIKSPRVLAAQADPLIYQLYKSLACFGSSLVILLYRNFAWTWWGVVGATMWVLTGTLAIYAIQRAGLGLAQTTYSCLTVFISFLWGVAAFHEKGNNVGLSLLGLSLITFGLAGLGHAVRSKPLATLQRVPSAESTSFFHIAGKDEQQVQQQVASLEDAGGSDVVEFTCEPDWQPAGELDSKRSPGVVANGGSFPDLQVRIGAQLHRRSISGGDLMAVFGEEEDASELVGYSPASSSKPQDLEAALLLGLGPPGELRIILRQNLTALRVRLRAAWASGVGRGMLAAVLIGVLNGSSLVPYKLARQRDKVQGIEYVASFAASSMLVTLLVCFVYYGLVKRQRPQLHLHAVAGPALLTGTLWSIGNVCSIYAVQMLGLSVGFPLVQCQLIVAAAWAVLYYREVPANTQSVSMFVGSTLVVVLGMMMLAVYGS